MTELRTIADANIPTFGLIEDLIDVPRTEDPDAAKPGTSNHNKFGAMEDLTDLPRPEQEPDAAKPGTSNHNKFGAMEDLTDLPRPEQEPDAAKPGTSNHNKFGAMEDLTDLPRPEQEPDAAKPGTSNHNKFGAMEDLTDLPRPEETVNYRTETLELIAIDDNVTYNLFHSIDELSDGDSNNIQGTSGNDYLVGEHYIDDAIFGAGGADTLKGLDGADFLFGGTGNDKIYGGRGDDWLEGNSGNDFLVGHANDDGHDYYEVDTLTGGSGADTFSLVMEGPELEIPYVDGLGEHAYAIIRDFNKADGDAILMVGKKQDYEFVSGYYGYGNALTKDTKIFYDGDMIAVVTDKMAADLTLSFV